MRNPQKNDRTFLAQLRKSHAAFTTRAADFASYPIELDAYDSVIDTFEASVMAETHYETETLTAYQAAIAEYRATVDAARTKLAAVRTAAENERVHVGAEKKNARDAAEKLFHQYQNIAEAVYLGSDRPDVLPEFDTPVATRTVKVKTTTPATNTVA